MISRIWHGLVRRVTVKVITVTSRRPRETMHYIGMADLDNMVDDQVQCIGCYKEDGTISWQHTCGPMCISYKGFKPGDWGLIPIDKFPRWYRKRYFTDYERNISSGPLPRLLGQSRLF